MKDKQYFWDTNSRWLKTECANAGELTIFLHFSSERDTYMHVCCAETLLFFPFFILSLFLSLYFFRFLYVFQLKRKLPCDFFSFFMIFVTCGVNDSMRKKDRTIASNEWVLLNRKKSFAITRAHFYTFFCKISSFNNFCAAKNQ